MKLVCPTRDLRGGADTEKKFRSFIDLISTASPPVTCSLSRGRKLTKAGVQRADGNHSTFR